MAYTDTIKLRAYTLYLEGLNYEQIAARLKELFALPKLKGQTVKLWAEKADTAGETWETSRARVRESLRRGAENAVKSKLTELREKTETIQEAIYNQLVDEKAKVSVKSFEGAVYAFKTIAEFGINLEKMERDHLHPMLIIQAMLEVFQEIPAVRKVIKENWGAIKKGIMERLSEGGVRSIDYAE